VTRRMGAFSLFDLLVSNLAGGGNPQVRVTHLGKEGSRSNRTYRQRVVGSAELFCNSAVCTVGERKPQTSTTGLLYILLISNAAWKVKDGADNEYPITQREAGESGQLLVLSVLRTVIAKSKPLGGPS